MRRAVVRNLELADVDFKKKTLKGEEKGGLKHAYKTTNEGLPAIQDYIEYERKEDLKKWQSGSLFLSAATTAHGDGQLNPRVMNNVWNEVCKIAGVDGKTPHSARHAMGKI